MPKNPYAINFSLSKAQLEKLGTFQTEHDSSRATAAKRLLLEAMGMEPTSKIVIDNIPASSHRYLDATTLREIENECGKAVDAAFSPLKREVGDLDSKTERLERKVKTLETLLAELTSNLSYQDIPITTYILTSKVEDSLERQDEVEHNIPTLPALPISKDGEDKDELPALPTLPTSEVEGKNDVAVENITSNLVVIHKQDEDVEDKDENNIETALPPSKKTETSSQQGVEVEKTDTSSVKDVPNQLEMITSQEDDESVENNNADAHKIETMTKADMARILKRQKSTIGYWVKNKLWSNFPTDWKWNQKRELFEKKVVQ